PPLSVPADWRESTSRRPHSSPQSHSCQPGRRWSSPPWPDWCRRPPARPSGSPWRVRSAPKHRRWRKRRWRGQVQSGPNKRPNRWRAPPVHTDRWRRERSGWRWCPWTLRYFTISRGRGRGAGVAIHGVDAGDALESLGDVLQPGGVAHLDREVNHRLAVARPRADVLDVVALLRDHVGDGVEHPLAVIGVDHQLHLAQLARLRRPGDLDPPVGVVEQVAHIGAGDGVHAHAATAGDIADDRLPGDG